VIEDGFRAQFVLVNRLVTDTKVCSCERILEELPLCQRLLLGDGESVWVLVLLALCLEAFTSKGYEHRLAVVWLVR
jgi:hypothetical protein